MPFNFDKFSINHTPTQGGGGGGGGEPTRNYTLVGEASHFRCLGDMVMVTSGWGSYISFTLENLPEHIETAEFYVRCTGQGQGWNNNGVILHRNSPDGTYTSLITPYNPSFPTLRHSSRGEVTFPDDSTYNFDTHPNFNYIKLKFVKGEGTRIYFKSTSWLERDKHYITDPNYVPDDSLFWVSEPLNNLSGIDGSFLENGEYMMGTDGGAYNLNGFIDMSSVIITVNGKVVYKAVG